ncbi:hypothetical protein C8F01DRAFT_1079564 [Mycena amicta]|nr:hypothetical protein C8F01DRAFT_1079564 [Mycena amicta]
MPGKRPDESMLRPVPEKPLRILYQAETNSVMGGKRTGGGGVDVAGRKEATIVTYVTDDRYISTRRHLHVVMRGLRMILRICAVCKLAHTQPARSVVQRNTTGALHNATWRYRASWGATLDPATSVNVERAFSHGSGMVTKRCHALSAETMHVNAPVTAWHGEELVPESKALEKLAQKKKKTDNVIDLAESESESDGGSESESDGGSESESDGGSEDGKDE